MACSIAVVSGMAFEASIAKGPGIHTIYGLAPSKLTHDIEQAIRKGVSGILSFGTAAGLMPSLTTGSIIIARHVLWQQQIYTADAAWASWLVRHLPASLIANIAGVDSPLASVQEKSALRKNTGATAADMESHHVGRLAQRYNLPFAAIRIVLDDAKYALPPAVLVTVTPEGNISYGRLLASLASQPLQLAELLHLAMAAIKAKKSLLRCSSLLKESLFGYNNLPLSA